MQTRQLTRDYYGMPNYDNAVYRQMYEDYQTAVRGGTAILENGQPSPTDIKTGAPIMVKAKFIRVGQISGEIPQGFLEVDVCFCDENGQTINSMTKTVSIPLTGSSKDGASYDISGPVARLKTGDTQAGDNNAIYDAVLNSPQCFTLAV